MGTQPTIAGIPVYVISLRDCETRRQTMTERLGALGIPFQFFDAIDGRKLSPDQVKTISSGDWPLGGAPLAPGEIGCMASHVAVCRMIGDGPDPFVCVLEDDVDVGDLIHVVLDAEFLQTLPPFDILRLEKSWWGRRRFMITRAGGVKICAPLRPSFGSMGQIYSRNGARKIADRLLPANEPLDWCLYQECRISGLRLLDTDPRIIGAIEGPSTIQGRNMYMYRGRFPGRLYKMGRRLRWLRNFVRAWGWRALIATGSDKTIENTR
jgi:glycosyl transferase, family 25